MTAQLTAPMASMPGPASTPAPSSAEPLLDVRGLTMHFPLKRTSLFQRAPGVVRAVDGVDLAIRKGETVGLVGESGCGKSTTGRAILQLYRPTSGSVTFDGIELTTLRGREERGIRRRMQMIFQDPYSSLNPRQTVGRIISTPLEVHDLARGAAKRERVEELLRIVGMNPQFASRYPHEFSGGQRQRIGIARALAVSPEFIVADEPISALDVSIQAQVINLLEELQSTFGLTYLFVAHDLAVVRHISDRVAVMYLGRIVELATSAELYERPRHPYTIALLSAVPVADPVIEARRRRIILTGDVPTPVNPPSGCHFHTRCWLRERLGNPENCRTEDPPLRDAGGGHLVACHWLDEVPESTVEAAVPAALAAAPDGVAAPPRVRPRADARREASEPSDDADPARTPAPGPRPGEPSSPPSGESPPVAAEEPNQGS
jgi:oligopeptide transport system ATP-binding protein